MSVTEASFETNFNTYIGDTSVDRISAAERLQLATEATVWLLEETGNDHMIRTHDVSYLDTVSYYKITTPLADLLEGADLRRKIGLNFQSMTHKSSREMAEVVANHTGGDAWGIERRNNDSFLVIDADSTRAATTIDEFETTGRWTAVTSVDAATFAIDTANYQHGNGSLRFTTSVDNANDIAIATTQISMNLSDFTATGVFLVDVYITDASLVNSFQLRWGTSSSNYYSVTATTDVNGSALAAGWQTLAFAWNDVTLSVVGSPSASSVSYFRLSMSYAGGFTNAVMRYDYLRITNPDTLTFYYTSFYVGTDTTGATHRLAFTATSDIPYFSGKYDQYKYAVSHKMASIAFYGPLQNANLGQLHEVEAIKALNRVKKLIPSSVTKEEKSFKVKGLNFARSGRGGRFSI